MVATGVLTRHDRVELIEGDMLDMAPIGVKHSAITTRLNEIFVLALSRSATIVVGGPVNLGEFSEPQPDLMLLKRRADFYGGRIPEASDVLLLVEISDSSLAFDQGVKLALYARFGVVEVWIIDIAGPTVEIYRGPKEGAYSLTERRTSGSLTPDLVPRVAIDVAALLA